MSAKGSEQASPSAAPPPASAASVPVAGAPQQHTEHAGATEGPALDRRGRPLRDLRISVTDRCNFRCSYCMPRSVFGPGFEFLPPAEILSFEEIARVSRACVSLGVRKLRLTGGEPLLRRGLPQLIEQLPREPGIDVALTTNGSLLERHARALAAAGLARVTVSLDSLDDAVFQRMNDADVSVKHVLAGIDAARAAGLAVKVNAVIQRGVNDAGMVDLVRHFKGSGISVRLIEFMDVGNSNGWSAGDVVSAQQMLATIGAHFPLEPVAPHYAGEVAQRHRFADGSGELGIIASVTQPFCGDCSRARLSAQGMLYTCLFAARGHDLRAALRGGTDDAGLRQLLAGVWQARRDAYSEQRGQPLVTLGRPRKIEMSYIGG
jgi:cyclic pyranopterin phosphate synthase